MKLLRVSRLMLRLWNAKETSEVSSLCKVIQKLWILYVDVILSILSASKYCSNFNNYRFYVLESCNIKNNIFYTYVHIFCLSTPCLRNQLQAVDTKLLDLSSAYLTLTIIWFRQITYEIHIIPPQIKLIFHTQIFPPNLPTSAFLIKLSSQLSLLHLFMWQYFCTATPQ